MIQEQSFRKAKVIDIIEVVSGDIIDLSKKKKVDAVVNAAKPTLMGGSGVDGAIHKEIDRLLEGKKDKRTFNDIIIDDLQKSGKKRKIKKNVKAEKIYENKVRCQPGEAVLTRGHKNFAKYVIHAVGSKNDGGSQCLLLLQKTYESVMKIIFENSDIHTVSIPVIGSGNYGFSMEVSFRIALTTIGNQLIECKNKNNEVYNNIQKIYLVIYNERASENDAIMKIYKENQKLLEQEKRMVCVNALTEHQAYLKEVLYFDRTRRHYFTITRLIRAFLVMIRFFFIVSLLIQQWSGKHGWRFRKGIIEFEAIIASFFPILLMEILQFVQYIQPGYIQPSGWILKIICFLCTYVMADTLTYLVSLIFLADIYRPSANQLRSFIILIFNYLQMLFGIAVFYYCYLWNRISFWQAMDYSILGIGYSGDAYSNIGRSIEYIKVGINFLFIVLAFSFAVAQLKQRRYLTE